MKIAILCNDTFSKKKDIANKAKKYNLDIAQENQKPDIVVCIGGDGTILFCEEKHPSVPKITIRDKNHIGKKCVYDISHIDEVFSKLSQNKFKIKKSTKIKCIFKNQKLLALNEIQIRNILPNYALRFSILARQNNKIIFNEKSIIGDGCVFATPFGSSAYFTSIGGKKFKYGLGVGLNNCFNKKKKIFYFDDDCIFECILERGDAYLLFDNSKNIMRLKKNKKIVLTKADDCFNEVRVE